MNEEYLRSWINRLIDEIDEAEREVKRLKDQKKLLEEVYKMTF